MADGIGGHAGGELAAQTAIQELRKIFEDLHPVDSEKGEDTLPSEDDNDFQYKPEEIIEFAVKQVSKKVRATPDAGGTTLVCLLVRDGRVYWGHVGDSRIYRFHDAQIQKVTFDHGKVEDAIRTGKLTKEEAAGKRRNAIINSIGFTPEVFVEVASMPTWPPDRFLLCSDGLTNELKSSREELTKKEQEWEKATKGKIPTIKEILAAEKNTQKACQILVKKAVEHGGRDNTTALLVDVRYVQHIGDESNTNEEITLNNY